MMLSNKKLIVKALFIHPNTHRHVSSNYGVAVDGETFDSKNENS